MSFSAQYPPVLTEAGDLTSEVLAKYNQEFQYLYTNLLSALFSATTGHAHTGNGSDGAQIAAGSIANDAITTLKILNEAVTAAKLATDAVTTLKILDAAITTAKFALDAKCPLAGTADKVANALTVNGTAFDGSAAQEVIFPSHGQQLFTSSGTFTVPTGVTKAYVTGCGGGGGGSNGSLAGGGGGGAHAVINQAVTGLTPGSSITVTVGGGGAGAVQGNYIARAGGAGGTSSFGAYVSLAGGGGGSATAGENGSMLGGSAGGLGGTAGQSGRYEYYGSDYSRGWGGAGGGCLFGAGGSGGMYSNSREAGKNGSLYGAGGGGGVYWDGTASAGGAGAQGFILVEW